SSIQELDIHLAAGKVLGDQYMAPAPLIQLASEDLSVLADPKARAAAEPFVKAMKDKYGRTDNAQASRAWDSMMMMVMAMKRANTTEGEAVRDAFEKLGPYTGAGASYDFTTERHIGITTNPYVLVSVKNDKLVERK
ncbi:MAG: ABC transporter substrate-binding protein, partial [Pseudolabrys sp.]|nr:ABC transporter substrate-binding protein [Pseudolabrys sp.]